MGRFGDHLKLKESLRYLSLNKVRIASFKDKLNKKIGLAVEDMIRREENMINKLNNHKEGLNE